MRGRWMIWVAAAALLALTSGCVLFVAGAAAGAGAGTYAYINGEVKEIEQATLDRTWKATLAAMKDLQFAITSQAKDALQGELTSRTAADKKITVSLKKVADQSTEIRIRVGTFGDESMSRTILYKIKSHL